jgi:hypothetical protein
LLAQHVAAHAQALQKANRDQWKAQGPQIQQYLQQLGAAAQQAAMQEQAAAQMQQLQAGFGQMNSNPQEIPV